MSDPAGQEASCESCGVCAECKVGAACTATFRLYAAGPKRMAEQIASALGFINRMRGVDSNVDAVLAQVQRLLTASQEASDA